MEKETLPSKEYSANFKLRVILDVLNNGLSIHDAVNTILHKACLEKETAWITVLWRTFLDD